MGWGNSEFIDFAENHLCCGLFGDFSLRSFLDLCLSENQRRFAPYDSRLLRPTLVPGTVRFLLKVLPRGRQPRDGNPETIAT